MRTATCSPLAPFYPIQLCLFLSTLPYLNSFLLMLSFQACSKINLSRKDTPAANYLLSKEPEKTVWKGGTWHIKQFPRQENLPQRRRYELRARGETEMKQEIRNGRSLSGKPKEMNESRKEPPNCSFQRTRIPATQLKRRPRRAAELGVRRTGKPSVKMSYTDRQPSNQTTCLQSVLTQSLRRATR